MFLQLFVFYCIVMKSLVFIEGRPWNQAVWCFISTYCGIWMFIKRGRGILLPSTIKIAYFSLLLRICLDQSLFSMTFHGCISFISECLGALKNHESRPFLDTTPIMQVSLFVFASSVQVVIYLLYAITGFWKRIAGYQKIIIYHELFILFSVDHFIGTHIFSNCHTQQFKCYLQKERKIEHSWGPPKRIFISEILLQFH